MNTQPDLFSPPAASQAVGITEADVRSLRAQLMSIGSWQTRNELCRALGWPDRKVREVAEAMGAEVVRCQLGFKLTALVTREDLPAIKQAIDAFHSQANKMEAYALALRKRLHALIG
jgi:hypothetical protein